jgi:hypothetical protein
VAFCDERGAAAVPCLFAEHLPGWALGPARERVVAQATAAG